MKSVPIFSISIPIQLKAGQKQHQIIVMEEKSSSNVGKMKAAYSASMCVMVKTTAVKVKTRTIVLLIKIYSKKMRDSRYYDHVS